MARLRMMAVPLALGLALVAQAAAADLGTYTGSLEPSGKATVTREFEEMDGYLFRSYTFDFKRVPLECKRGKKARMSFGGSNSIRDDQIDADRFGFTSGQQDPDGSTNYEWTVDGRVGDKRAKGIVRAHGPEVPLPGGGTGDCDSGTIHFSLKK